MENKIYLFAVVLLSVCQASVSLDEQSCTPNKTEVTVTPTSLEEIMNYFNFGESITQILEEALAIETQIAEEAFSNSTDDEEDDKDLNITELITKYGFTPEVHEVTTKDGYELMMHRIVGNGSVVFLMHGLLCSSDDWIIGGPGNSLALVLASAGYDVWMGNARGNKHSNKHVSLSPNCDQYWKFGLDEIGVIDIPSMIDYALNFTGKSYLSFVGHAQGATNLVALCSDMPEYNEKMSVAVLLSPAIYESHWKTPIFRLISLNPEAIYTFTQSIGVNNPTPDGVKAFLKGLCGNNPLSKILCSNIIGLLSGYSRGQLNIARLPVIFSHFPAGASIRQLIHFGQSARTGKFQKFNFSKEKNLEVYGSEEPPVYEPAKLTAPVAVLSGEYDWFSDVNDVNQLVGELPNVASTTLLKNFAHLDQPWCKNCKEILIEPVVELISKYQK